MLEKSIAAINKIQDLIKTTICPWALPFTCALCNQPSDRRQDLCYACLQDLPIIAQSCQRCANKIPFTPPAGPTDKKGLICGSCLKGPPPFSASHALFAYEPPITSLILGLKFKHQLAYARILGELMAEKIGSEWYHNKPLPDLIIPVPLYQQRLQERGFNQALELARPIARAFHLKVDSNSVQRIKNTLAQMNLPAQKRKTNIKNAFAIDRPLIGKTIAILDDVMTTGSTVAELSHVLLQKGATRVDVWCCARAMILSPD